jgi:hypothetical protein
MKPPIDVAIEMANDFGWRVFPANPNNKKPLIANWQNLASKDPVQIRELFARWPNAMIGLPTGAINGITVVDVDIRDDKDGFVTVEDLGLQRLSIYPAVQTPSGGVHLYIVTGADHYSSSAGRLGLGLDIRSHGGYVIGAGSVSSAGQYQWICDKQRAIKNDYPMIHELRALLKRTKPRLYSQAGSVAKELLRPITEGSRNVELARRCGFLMKKYKPQIVLDMIHHINKTCCTPPLDSREVLSVFNSIRKREGV